MSGSDLQWLDWERSLPIQLGEKLKMKSLSADPGADVEMIIGWKVNWGGCKWNWMTDGHFGTSQSCYLQQNCDE